MTDDTGNPDFDDTQTRFRRSSSERLTSLEDGFASQGKEIHELTEAIRDLSGKIGPILTERMIVLKFMRYWLGVWTGIGVSVTAAIGIAIIMHYLRLQH